MWVNPNAHCASCVPSTGYVGKGKGGELRGSYSEAVHRDLAVSTACKFIVLNE